MPELLLEVLATLKPGPHCRWLTSPRLLVGLNTEAPAAAL